MNTKIINVVLTVFLTIMYLLVYSQNLYNEGFESFYNPNYCKDCNRSGWRGEQECMQCGNCGWCIDPNGNGSCVQGDARGPYFADCVQYYYNGGYGTINPPFGPMQIPWYQKFVIPWYGGPYNLNYNRFNRGRKFNRRRSYNRHHKGKYHRKNRH